MERQDRNPLVATVIGNLVTVVIAVWQQWSPLLMMWPFWMQSVAIGWYNGRRMLALEQFSTEGFSSNGKRVPENEEGKRSTVFFFAVHYGFFHLIYGLFLAEMTSVALDGRGARMAPLASRDLWLTFALGAMFFWTQRKTFRQQVEYDATRKPNLGAMMFMPYVRVVPMHLAIILGAAFAGAGVGTVLFGTLKTIADVGMQLVENRGLRRKQNAGAVPER